MVMERRQRERGLAPRYKSSLPRRSDWVPPVRNVEIARKEKRQAGSGYGNDYQSIRPSEILDGWTEHKDMLDTARRSFGSLNFGNTTRLTK